MSGAGAVRFTYVARDEAGRRLTGALSAADGQAAREMLRRQGLHPIALDSADAPAPARRRRSARPLGLAGRAAVFAALARMTRRKVSAERALAIVARGSDAGAAAAETARRALREGRTVGDALAEAGLGADPGTRALVRSGEAAGDLPGALAAVAGLLAGRLAAERKLATRLVYPAALSAVACVSVGLVLVVILPEFRPLVADRFDLVPPLGRAVFAVADVLEALWPALLAAGGLAGVALGLAARRRRLGPALVGAAARLPWFSGVIEAHRAALMLRVLGALALQKVPLVPALRILAETADDPSRDRRLKSATLRVEKGEGLADALGAEGLAPAAQLEMVRIGEETGTLGEMLTGAADDLAEASDRLTERALALIEPALIVVVGLIVGVSLYALFTAITAVNSVAF